MSRICCHAVIFVGACVGIPSFAQTPASVSFISTMRSLQPVGWWRLGETSGTRVADASGRGHTGTYNNTPGLGIIGAIAGDGNTAVKFTGSQKEYVEIPDDDDFSLTKAQDGFDRSVPLGSSWGTADHGGTWTAQVSSGSFYSCNGSVAKIDETGTGGGAWQMGLGFTLTNVDLQVKASWNHQATGGPLQPVMLVARRLDNSNLYRAELRENVGGRLELVLAKSVDGTLTTLARATGVGIYSASALPPQWWYLRFQVNGTSLRAKAWQEGTAQPTTWTVTTTDSSLPSAGGVGIRSANSSSTARPVVSFDDFRAQFVGKTVHVWMRPDILDLAPEDYVYYLGKGENGNQEWAFRFRDDNADSTRPSQISAYHYSLDGGEGAGAGFNPDQANLRGIWQQVVAGIEKWRRKAAVGGF